MVEQNPEQGQGHLKVTVEHVTIGNLGQDPDPDLEPHPNLVWRNNIMAEKGLSYLITKIRESMRILDESLPAPLPPPGRHHQLRENV